MSEIASESGHWYERDGTPRYEVEAVNGSGLRPTTLRDARKLDLLPSVTTICRMLAAPGLDNWKQEQAIMSALTLPRHEGETDAEFIDRIKYDGRERAKKAAERGTALHTDIERAIQGKPHTLHQKHVEILAATMEVAKLNLYEGEAEKTFAHPDGFAGKIDYRFENVVVDFKSKDSIPQDAKLTYDEHIIQLAAYAYGLGIPGPRCINIFVGIDDRVVAVREWEEKDIRRGLEMFLLLLLLWRSKNRFQWTKDE